MTQELEPGMGIDRSQPFRIDGLQYNNWSEKIFRQWREGGLDAVHVTIAYHENFREMVQVIERWNRWFETFPELIVLARGADDVRRAREEGRTAVVFGAVLRMVWIRSASEARRSGLIR